jgi:uncharacterized membrane protein YjjP (DUF1212 family)
VVRGLRSSTKRPADGLPKAWSTGTFSRDAVIGPAVVDDATVHLVVDLALRIGELQLAGGAGAADVTATILAVTEAYGLPQCEVDVIFTSITVCCHRGVEAPPVTTTRVVRLRALDYTRLAMLDQIVVQIVRAKLSASQAYQELDKLITSERTYPRWVSTVAWAAMAASLTVLIGADIRLAGIAGLLTALVDRIGRVLNRRSLPFFFQQVVGAGVVSILSVGVYARLWSSHLLPPEFFSGALNPSLVLAASLTVLLSGLSLVGTVQDAITGFYVTAAGRAFEVAMMSAGLVAGVVLALQASGPLQTSSAPANTGLADITPPAFSPPELNTFLLVQIVAAGCTAVFFALASSAPPRALVGAALGGGLSFTIYGIASAAALGPTAASALGAIVVGFAGRLVSRRLGLPPLVMAVAGITPLLPGLTTYRGVLELTVQNDPDGLVTLLSAASIGLALAAGVVLGEFLAQPLRTGLGRLERRLHGPRLVGPLEPGRRRLD